MPFWLVALFVPFFLVSGISCAMTWRKRRQDRFGLRATHRNWTDDVEAPSEDGKKHATSICV
jgi:hypothetical protein